MPSNKTLALYGLGGGVGLFVTMWSFQTYLWYGYQRANPEIGTISTTPGFELFLAVLFIVGIVVAFTAFSRGLGHVLDTTN
jgi:hypothetical protein